MSPKAPTELRLGPDFTIPIGVVTQTLALLARKRVGKSNGAVVIAEELYDAHVPWCAIDPKGDWWGLRSSADGNGPGLEVIVFGGEHGDVPLEPTAGKLVAELVVEQRLTCILDVSEMTKADQRRFLKDYVSTLYRINREPLFLICEEADEYIPQRFTADMAGLIGAFETIVKRGGFRGIGILLVTQRSASLNNDVLTQIDTLLVMQTTGPPDLEAIKRWIKHHSLSEQVLGELQTLPVGDVWMFSPGWLQVLERHRFRRRRTFDSGATPTLGQATVEPRLADVDLAAIKEAMAATIEKAKERDPAEIRKAFTAQLRERDSRIHDLERQLTAATPDPVRVPFVPAGVVTAAGEAERAMGVVLTELRHLAEAVDVMQSEIAAAAVPANVVAIGSGRRATTPPAAAPPAQAPLPARQVDERLGKGEDKVMAVLAQWPQGRTHNELAFLAGYSSKASTLGVILAKLRRLGYVTPGGPVITLTEEGMTAAGGPVQMPTGRELLEQWRRHPRMGEGERRVLDVLVDHYPTVLSHEQLCEFAGYSPGASTMGVILSKLRKLGLVAKGERVLASEFAEAIR